MQREGLNKLYRVIENAIPKNVISNKNRNRSWLYGYNEKYDLVVISKTGQIEQVIEDSAIATRDEARTIKNDLKGEIVRTERLVESIERRVKGIQDSTRKMIDKENDRNDKIRERIQTRMDNLDDTLSNKMKALEKDTNDKINKALKNPLSKLQGGG